MKRVNKDRIIIEGYAKDEQGLVNFTLNKNPIVVAENGYFNTETMLAMDTNDFVFTLTDELGYEIVKPINSIVKQKIRTQNMGSIMHFSSQLKIMMIQR